MMRLSFVCGIVLSCLLATDGLGQSGAAPATGSGQVSQLRPGWNRTGIDPANSRERYTVTPVASQESQTAESSGGRSFLPNWFGWRYEKPQQKNNGNKTTPSRPQQSHTQQSGNTSTAGNNARGQSTNNAGATSQYRAGGPTPNGTRVAALPPDPTIIPEATLPGLGGTPLPRAGSAARASSPNQPRGVANTSPMTAQPTPETAGLRTATREPLAAPAESLGEGTPVTRGSPGRRSTPHLSADDMRRELSGTFPPSASASSPPNGSTLPRQGSQQAAIAAETTATADAHFPATRGSSSSPAAEETMVTDSAPSGQTDMATEESAATPGSIATTPSTSGDGGQSPTLSRPANAVSSRYAAEAFDGAQQSRSAYGGGNAFAKPFSRPPSSRTQSRGEPFGGSTTVAPSTAASTTTARNAEPNVLASNHTPVLTADIRGPKQILVGREATYRVRLQNSSDVPAEGIVATIVVPAGADVMNTSATQGVVQTAQDGQTNGQLQWHLNRLDQHASETLEVRLVPRESRPLELGINWTLAPVASRAVVEVQEAKLNVEISGPNEVLFEKPQVFKITLTNPGTGTAENVKIDLLPPGGGQESATSHTVGDLPAGASQSLEIELTPRDAGKLQVKAIASAAGDLTCESAKEIFCRKPELELDWRGPSTKYADTLATYYLRARNPGTAPAEQVTVQMTLPAGAEFTSASDGQTYDAASRTVSWRLGTLGPGDDAFLELKCVLKTAGKNVVKLSAANAEGTLSASKIAETNVVAIADLKLNVVDPSGPIAVGSPAVYEIHIQNRGASAAKDVHVVALFSEGIEPEQAEGAMYSVADGRVSFKPIEDLAAGREIVLRIRAHALQPGTHVFRTEVLCRELEIKLAAEETTRFYADDATPAGGTESQSASRSTPFDSEVK
ncbi:MAG: DUF11 domain-containing protein [Pirellulales bacterium]|nr:DUF11 domain-containing protein [Pirellulales bacterium]